MKNDGKGYFGKFGGSYTPEVLRVCLKGLRNSYRDISQDATFWQEFETLLTNYSSRPTPLTFADNLTRHLGGAQVYIKREDLNHTGSHKVNNVLGQGLLCKRMGKKRVIAETGAGQHGLATATMAAKFGFECTIYMGAKDVRRQRPNVFWMEKLGAEVIAVEEGSRTLKDAVNDAFRDWVNSFDDTHYVFGTACGPSPFPEMVAEFQSVIGKEARQQIMTATGQLPDKVYACVGGGSNALGIFSAFMDDQEVELVGVEAGGKGLDSDLHAARLSSVQGKPGVVQGYKSCFLQNDDGQMLDTHSIAAGLDYVGVSPILAHLSETRRVRFTAATDEQVLAAMETVIRHEGIVPALESAHAFAAALAEIPDMSPQQSVIINQSGRGDKDIFTIAEAFGDSKWQQFIKERADEY
ncbi:tryptophan synthase subunit beta [Solemya velum gill symbiont]|uniref:Tryptophan synthase beta chain n=4 Tax=Solemya velum gill symbiont TaxID=2340 RepID=A0A1T2FS33_SOVGS|nr:tryptophan synthase subunit beta [Solemya velum gill symbiont]OOY33819.1 tryptophan synthase subunit beta [Solemya velum gill symbiont]OOY53398.1 tryptophan synthase subunit beta [Solemya velum gill symbiont]OOY57235.1 tryptophan synthase subunit beta [Solemya velum gill symbiont]OOY58431.1 tryptophan synthase subunit beta [Solemya velum gill symbiont]OOY62083.1 tryptophan synthase subunit beta [Solemya velum gill symbiont]